MKKLILSMIAVLLLAAISVSAADLQVNSITASPSSANPGTEITFTAELENTGTTDIATVKLTSTQLTRTASTETLSVPAITDVTDLKAGNKTTQTWNVTLPKTLSGSYDATLTAEDASNITNKEDKTYSVTVNSYRDMSTSVSSIAVTGQKDAKQTATFTVTNDGSENLDVTLTASQVLDDDSDETTVSFSPDSLTGLAPGASSTINVEIDVDNRMDTGEYTSTITLKAGTLEKTVSLKIEVEPEICKYGKVGDLRVKILEPDNGDDFKIGETITIEVDVENNYKKDLDVAVTAILYDFTDDKAIKTVKLDPEKIDDKDDREFEFDFELPTSSKIDEDNTFYLYVKSCKDNGEDDHCDYDRVRLNLEREEDDVAITNVEISPETGLQPGSSMNVIVDVENIGTDEQDNVYIEIKSKELSISQRSKEFSLEEYDDKDNDYTEQFLVKIPATVLSGTYWLDVKVYYNDGDDYKMKQVQITVEGDATATGTAAKTVNGISLTLQASKIALADGQTKWAIPVVLENTGLETAKLTLDATEMGSWAETLAVESPQELHPGEKYHAYVYLKLKDDATPGIHNIRVNLRNANGLLQSQMLEVTVPAKADSSITGDAVKEESGAKKFFSDKSKMFWIIADILLVLIAIFFIRVLFKK